MKKLVTLLLAAASFSGAYAQSETTEEARRIILGDRRDPRTEKRDDDKRVDDERSNYPSNRSGSEAQVNREYDAKIRSIRNNPTLTGAEKERIIRDLERQRENRIREIRGNGDYGRNNDRRRHEDDDRYEHKKKNKHKQKGNNGNHYGWKKGKGNPHRDRD